MVYTRTRVHAILAFRLSFRLFVRLTFRIIRFELRYLFVLALIQERVCVSVTHVLDASYAPAFLLCNHECQLLIGRSHEKVDLLIRLM